MRLYISTDGGTRFSSAHDIPPKRPGDAILGDACVARRQRRRHGLRAMSACLRLICRAAAAAAALVIALAGVAVRASAETPVVLDPTGMSVAAYGGWTAWSRSDATTNRDELVLRSPQ